MPDARNVYQQSAGRVCLDAALDRDVEAGNLFTYIDQSRISARSLSSLFVPQRINRI